MKQKQVPEEQKAFDDGMKQVFLVMAESDHFIPSDIDLKDLLKQFVDEKAPKVKCQNCKYTWTPNPYLWRDDPENPKLMEYKGRLVKPLICPACNTRVKMEIGGFLLILTWWTKYKMMQKAIEKGIEEVRKMYS